MPDDDEFRRKLNERNAQRRVAMDAGLGQKTQPWHAGNRQSLDASTAATWSARCHAWCDELMYPGSALTLRTHVACERCGFRFIARTSNFSMRSSADVENEAVCCNPDCKHRWTEVS